MFGVHLGPPDVPCCYNKEGEWASLSISRILSRTTIHLGVSLPTRSCGYPGLSRRTVDAPVHLAPSGVYQAATVTRDAGGLLHHRFTLACVRRHNVPVRHRRSALCCTFRRVAPPGSYPAPCPVESGLSSTNSVSCSQRPSDRLAMTSLGPAEFPSTSQPPGEARNGRRDERQQENAARRCGTTAQHRDDHDHKGQDESRDGTVKPLGMTSPHPRQPASRSETGTDADQKTDVWTGIHTKCCKEPGESQADD